ncbi:MAG: aromatic ring-hydroxylating dioxygenase subunit alpha [Chitinophagales bacterium]|nr:aromatic ring-hydroxylating dioxygenase subunit alpha [Chitinophagales bacterium]
MEMIKNQWYLACLLDELKDAKPLKKKIVGEELVVFKTESGKIGVVEDRCCHRNVNLSLGYVKGETIKCGYHGWEYDTQGACTCIPSLPAGEKIPRTIKVKAYPVELRHQGVWVYIGDEALMAQASIPPMAELDAYPLVYNYHYLDADLKLVAESLIDAYHINHVHRNSIKNFMGHLHAEEVDFNLNVQDTWMTGEYLRHNDGNIWDKFYFGFDRSIKTKFGFWFPHTSKLDIQFKKRRMVIYEHFFQVDEHTISMCQITAWQKIFNEFPLFFFDKPFMLAKSNKIVEEDLVFLENNKRLQAATGHRDILIPSDTVTFEFSKLWNRNLQKHEATATPKNQGQAAPL